jgi:hypothetical protein
MIIRAFRMKKAIDRPWRNLFHVGGHCFEQHQFEVRGYFRCQLVLRS